MRRSIRWCLEQGHRAVTRSVTGHRRQRLLRVAARRRGCVDAGDTTCGCSTSTRCRRPTRSSRVRARRHPRRGDGAGGASTASTSCSTTSPRCRSPGTRCCCARSTSTAPHPARRCARRRGRARSCTPRRARCSACPTANPVLPTTVPRPVEAYGHAKLAAEWACLDGRRARVSTSPIVRPRTILGHGRLGIFGILFDWIADGADVFVLGDGSNRYQFVHADDLAEVCLLAAGDASGPDDLQRRHRPVRHDARDARGAVRATPAPAPRCARCRPGRPPLAMRLQRRARHRPVRAVPLDDVLEVDVVRHRPRPRRARLEAGVLERRDVRRRATTGSCSTAPDSATARLPPPPSRRHRGATTPEAGDTSPPRRSVKAGKAGRTG